MAHMNEIEITVRTQARNGGSELIQIAARGELAAALRSCILRLGDRFAADADVQRIVEAVARETAP